MRIFIRRREILGGFSTCNSNAGHETWLRSDKQSVDSKQADGALGYSLIAAIAVLTKSTPSSYSSGKLVLPTAASESGGLGLRAFAAAISCKADSGKKPFLTAASINMTVHS